MAPHSSSTISCNSDTAMKSSARLRLILTPLLFLVANADAFTASSHTVALTYSPLKALQSAPKRVTNLFASSVRAPDKENSDDGCDKSSSSVAGATFSLIKAMLGTGILALPAGLAAITDYKSGLVPANILLAVLGVLSGYTFALYGRLTRDTGATSLGDLWKKVQNTDDSRLVNVANFVYCFGCSLVFSLVIGDSLSNLAKGIGLQGLLVQRQTAILGTTAAVLFPLCNLQSLAALAPISILGVVGSMVTTLFLGYRCPSFVKNSPYSIPGKGMLESLPTNLQPQFSTYRKGGLSPAPLVLMSMGSVALMAHFSVPEFYKSVQSKTDAPKDTMKKFYTMTVVGYATVIIMDALSIIFGFLTFGANSQGIVLNNYSPKDVGAIISRFLVAVSVIGGFPLIFGACRSSGMELFGPGKDLTRSREKKYTAILLSVVTALALLLKDAGFVVSFNGALMGSLIIYVFPCMLFLKQTAGKPRSRLLSMERAFNRFLVGFGVASALIGAGTSVLNSYFPHLI